MLEKSPINIQLKRVFVIVASIFFALSMLMLGITNLIQSNTPKATENAINVDTSAVTESTIIPIILTGEASRASQEFSGMAWSDGSVILMPQYPSGHLFRLNAEVLRTAIIEPTIAIPTELITFIDDGIRNQVGRFEGYEAIAFDRGTVYATIEAREGLTMRSYLVKGQIDTNGITLDATSILDIPQPANLSNSAHEALVIVAGTPIVIYERNGEPNTAIALRLADDGQTWDTIPMPPLPYRVTDATQTEDNIFWVMNYNFDDTNLGNDDPLINAFGYGKTHQQYTHVERLVALQIHNDQIRLAQIAPIYLTLIEDARNWEGIVRFDDGWLVITDKFPSTLLAFVSPVNNP